VAAFDGKVSDLCILRCLLLEDGFWTLKNEADSMYRAQQSQGADSTALPATSNAAPSPRTSEAPEAPEASEASEAPEASEASEASSASFDDKAGPLHPCPVGSNSCSTTCPDECAGTSSLPLPNNRDIAGQEPHQAASTTAAAAAATSLFGECCGSQDVRCKVVRDLQLEVGGSAKLVLERKDDDNLLSIHFSGDGDDVEFESQTLERCATAPFYMEWCMLTACLLHAHCMLTACSLHACFASHCGQR
jgi:hypothetical protein